MPTAERAHSTTASHSKPDRPMTPDNRERLTRAARTTDRLLAWTNLAMALVDGRESGGDIEIKTDTVDVMHILRTLHASLSDLDEQINGIDFVPVDLDDEA